MIKYFATVSKDKISNDTKVINFDTDMMSSNRIHTLLNVHESKLVVFNIQYNVLYFQFIFD